MSNKFVYFARCWMVLLVCFMYFHKLSIACLMFNLMHLLLLIMSNADRIVNKLPDRLLEIQVCKLLVKLSVLQLFSRSRFCLILSMYSAGNCWLPFDLIFRL